MVHLSRIYTRTGDDGTTGLGDGSRRTKHDLRVAAYGTVDETNSALGIALVQALAPALAAKLRAIQNELFDVGSDLCVPGPAGEKLRILPSYVERLERWIDEENSRLAPLRSFVLPGGTPAAAYLHLARTIARRAERLVSELIEREPGAVNPEVLKYLNRLSDLLFVFARVANDDGRGDVLWQPGATRNEGKTGGAAGETR
ncbi:MAG: cob(I)yrinic acid a,c-diamide adenosyltransferase [Planctomycetes bacterium]|nr:cob(I)yrinic acid a,c-diamide adenosyltransferase [Planctomycetota bacterium]